MTQDTFEDRYLYFSISSIMPCSLKIKFAQSEKHDDLVKLELERKREAKAELRKNIMSYFTEKDPYYREMLKVYRQKFLDKLDFKK